MGGEQAVTHRDAEPPRTYAWLFMRLSGLILLGLATVHVLDRYLLGDVEGVTALSMAVRWRNDWWRFCDFAFVVLATCHASIGVHWAIERRVGHGTLRLVGEAGGAMVIGGLGLSAAWTVLTYGP